LIRLFKGKIGKYLKPMNDPKRSPPLSPGHTVRENTPSDKIRLPGAYHALPGVHNKSLGVD